MTKKMIKSVKKFNKNRQKCPKKWINQLRNLTKTDKNDKKND